MRELTVRIRFTQPSLGNVKQPGGMFHMPRDPQGRIMFLASWHKANMLFAAKTLGRHHRDVEQIAWDVSVDGDLDSNRWFRRWYRAGDGGRMRFSQHEAFLAGREIGINCVVPQRISDEDLWRLMQLAGQYKGLSPFKPGEFGFFEVVALLPRRQQADNGGTIENEVHATALK